MNETISFNLEFHSLCVLGLAVMMIAHLFLVYAGDTSKFAYLKRLMLFLPAYYGMLAFIIFSGILALAFNHFALSLSVVAMIIASILLIISGAKGFKALKKVRIFKDFGAFKLFMSKKIIFELVLLVVVWLLAKGF